MERVLLSDIDILEEKELIKKAKNGDEAAKVIIIDSLSGIVNREISRANCSPDYYYDLYHEAVLAIMESIKKFDFDYGVRFVTYSLWWISSFIQQAAVKYSNFVFVPKDAIIKINKTKRELLEKLNNEEITKQKYNELIDNLNSIPLRKAIEIDSFSESDTTLEIINATYVQRILSSAKYLLTKKQYDIIRSVYGINCIAMSMTELAGVYNCSKQNIEQIKNKAIQKIRVNLGLDNKVE